LTSAFALKQLGIGLVLTANRTAPLASCLEKTGEKENPMSEPPSAALEFRTVSKLLGGYLATIAVSSLGAPSWGFHGFTNDAAQLTCQHPRYKTAKFPQLSPEQVSIILAHAVSTFDMNSTANTLTTI
jgi:hypothetical protein